jgi:hypothetical protein
MKKFMSWMLTVTLERPQGAPSVNSLDGLPDGIYIVNGKKMLKK